VRFHLRFGFNFMFLDMCQVLGIKCLHSLDVKKPAMLIMKGITAKVSIFIHGVRWDSPRQSQDG